MRSRLVTFIISFLMWLLLSFNCDWQHLAAGAAAALIVTALMGDMFTSRPHHWLQPRRYVWFARGVAVFAWDCFLANINVAYLVIHPRLPINPGIVKVRTTLKTETGLAFLANFITLTPGTLTVDVDRDGGYLYIHWVNVQSRDVEQASRMIVSRFERILKEVFE